MTDNERKARLILDFVVEKKPQLSKREDLPALTNNECASVAGDYPYTFLQVRSTFPVRFDFNAILSIAGMTIDSNQKKLFYC